MKGEHLSGTLEIALNLLSEALDSSSMLPLASSWQFNLLEPLVSLAGILCKIMQEKEL